MRDVSWPKGGAWRSYLLLWLVAWLLSAGWLAWWGYEESFLRLHFWRSDWLDATMPHFTHLGDGLLLTGLMGCLLYRRAVAWWLLMATMVLVALAVALAKGVLFPDWGRPALVFDERVELVQLSLRPLLHRSFPSGHATAATAATIWPLLGGSLRGWGWGLGVGLFSLAMAYSRVYIGVHFLGDVLVGSLLGVGLALLMYRAGRSPLARWMQERSATWQRRQRAGQLWLSVSMVVGGALSVWDYYYVG